MVRQPVKCLQCDKSDVIDQTAKNVAEIKDALLGDEFHKVGLIEKVSRHHTRITRIERIIWIGSGVAMVVVFILKVVL
jgi:hypothetical protein